MDYIHVVLEFIHLAASVATIAGFIIDLRMRNDRKEDASSEKER